MCIFFTSDFTFSNSTMSLLLLLLPVALAGLPPHHQKLVDRFGAENVNFDKNVSIFPDPFEKLWNQKKSKAIEDILIRCELPSATLAWKSLLKATEGPKSISPTGNDLPCTDDKTQGKIDLRNESGRPMKVKVVGEVSEK